MEITFTKHYLVLFICLFLCLGFNASAQNNVISGVVSDADGLTLPGVSVHLKGSNLNTATGNDGAYKLTINRSLTNQDTLEFRYLGYANLSIAYTGNNAINARLKENTETLNEVVVTALGISRDKKALGYAATSVGESTFTDARSNNWVNSLSGKVAGVNLVSAGSGPVNSVRVTLRGANSLNPDGNNALIVLDGVPVSSSMTSSGVSSAYGAGSGNDVPVDFGNGISDINPDDIANVTVLKGASATALYGSRAANGALIITTKSGSKKAKGLGITINSNTSFNDVLKWPDYQYEYGQGVGKTMLPASQLYYSYGASADGASTSGTSSAFGPKFNGQMYYQYDPVTQAQSAERRPWVPYSDNIKSFYRTGSTITNSVSIEGGSEKTSARASITHSKNEWIMPNTGYERLSAALSLDYKVSDKLKINSKINYSNKKSDNLPATGYNNQSLSYFMIFQNPNVDLSWYEPTWKIGKEEIDQVHPFSSFIDNPYLIANNMTNAVNNYKTVGNLNATYDFTKNLSLMVRSGIDMSNEDRDQRRPYSTANFGKGYYKQQNIFNYEVNTDALLSYKVDINSSFKFNTSVGANARNQKYTGLDRSVEGLVNPGVYKLANGISLPLTKTVYTNKRVNSLYALASFSYQDKMFLDLTGRNDWSSSLPVQNNSFFYPSISSSFILNEIFNLPTAISFAKIRLSAAQVGNDTDPYKTSKYYGVSDFPSSGSVPTTLHNANFKPEITTSYEGGLEYNLFNNRFGMDVTLYSNITRNQILEVPLDATTGYSKAVLNSGAVRNQGIELMVNGKPFNGKNFKWSSTLTFAKNKNRVLELAAGMDNRQDIGYGGNATIQARVGGSSGGIYGFGFLRAPDGQIIFTADGLTAKPAEIQYIGDAYADWKGGLYNDFNYKNFSFSFLIDGQYGGMIYSQTHHKMSEQGKLQNTLPGREEGFIIGNGVVANADGTFSPNTKKVTVGDYYADYYRRANVEANSFDASFLKLREVRLQYNIPERLTNKIKVSNATVALYGRDLAIITSFPMFDPETAALNGSSILPGVEIGQLPSTRTFGMNLTLKF
ncbi:MAG: TonB-linked outer membrane protein SusC/RagA family [Sphingobacteriales bacterium]|nr:TonB-linked outer membrane protein SusC/RagA family [Sphingobacteriales bacterium]